MKLKNANALGIAFAALAICWFVLKCASSHEVGEPNVAYPPNASLAQKSEILDASFLPVTTGWPLPMIAGEARYKSIDEVWYLTQATVTRYHTFLWFGAATNLVVVVLLAVTFYTLASRLTLAHAMGFTAFSAWFAMRYKQDLSDIQVHTEFAVWLFIEQLTPLFVFAICLVIPTLVVQWCLSQSQKGK